LSSDTDPETQVAEIVPAELAGEPEASDKPVIERTSKGTFVKGQSGNPKGRAKGSRNNITIMRLETEEALRDFLAPKAKPILRKAVQMALDGNEKMLTVLLDKMLSSLRNEDVGEQRDTNVQVNIQNLTQTARDRASPPATITVKALPSRDNQNS
jgi:hypothetical protein